MTRPATRPRRAGLLALGVLGLALLGGWGLRDRLPLRGTADDGAQAAAPRPGTPVAPPVPLAGSRPVHVVGTSTFSRFHLLTTRDGAPPGADEAPEGSADEAHRTAEAEAAFAARRVRTAAREFAAAAEAAHARGRPAQEEALRLRVLHCRALLREPVEMLHAARAVLALREARGDGLAVARSQADVGALYGMLANHDRALDHLDAAATAFGRYGMRRLEAHARASMGLVYRRRADYGPALDQLERARALLDATRAATRKAYVLNLLGGVYEHLGDGTRALALYEEALAHYRDEDGVDKADVLGNLASLHFHRGEDEDAQRVFEQALEQFERHDDTRGMARALFGLGRVRNMQGGYRTALDLYERALDLQDDPAEAVRTRVAMAETWLAMGRTDDALAEIHRAREALGPGGMRMARVELQVVHALIDLRQDHPQWAIEKIRGALDGLMEVTAGLADEHVVGLREHRGWIFDAGVAVALRTGRVDLAVEFLEHGRAGALLEALGARGAQRGLPPDLREQATLAAHRVARAQRAYQEARQARRLQALRAADRELREAQADQRAVMQHLQRASKRAASVFHPVPDSLNGIRAQLAPGDVLVLYALLPFQAHALVLTPEGPGRMVWLGNTPDLRAACEALRAGGADADPAEVLARAARLRAMVLDPLDLPADTRRLFLGPDGPLCYVPFPLLLHDRDLDIACLPSGTTLRLLARERAHTGRGVLALGDPQYRIEHQGHSLQVYAEGAPLEPLPATRTEVLAITGDDDLRLLGSYATVRGLTETAATRPRWRAIHLACHGLIDPRTPTLSSLALTPEPGDDGFLTALEVYGLTLPADLVVLSGCNTGRGRFMKGEGLVGLMRAFMCAGAPRVVVSLWKVDDDATRALMTAFHRLVRVEGRPTAEALRRAQAEVAAVPAWSHPRYWGAWVLWGLAD